MHKALATQPQYFGLPSTTFLWRAMPRVMTFMILDPESQHGLFNHLAQTLHLAVAGGQVVAPDSDP